MLSLSCFPEHPDIDANTLLWVPLGKFANRFENQLDGFVKVLASFFKRLALRVRARQLFNPADITFRHYLENSSLFHVQPSYPSSYHALPDAAIIPAQERVPDG